MSSVRRLCSKLTIKIILCFWLTLNILTHFTPVFLLYTPRKRQKTFDVLVFSEGIRMDPLSTMFFKNVIFSTYLFPETFNVFNVLVYEKRNVPQKLLWSQAVKINENFLKATALIIASNAAELLPWKLRQTTNSE